MMLSSPPQFGQCSKKIGDVPTDAALSRVPNKSWPAAIR